MSILYHGDDFGTRELEPRWMYHEGSEHDWGMGIYFTDDINYAREYGNKICSINARGLKIHKWKEHSSKTSLEKRLRFIKYLEENSTMFSGVYEDVFIEYNNERYKNLIELLKVYNIAEWQMFLAHHIDYDDMPAFIEGWNDIIGIDGFFKSHRGVNKFCIMQTNVKVRPVNF